MSYAGLACSATWLSSLGWSDVGSWSNGQLYYMSRFARVHTSNHRKLAKTLGMLSMVITCRLAPRLARAAAAC